MEVKQKLVFLWLIKTTHYATDDDLFLLLVDFTVF